MKKQKHPKTVKEFRELLPPLDNSEFAILEASCRRDGIREAVIVWRDIVIDGHNRLTIAKKHKLPYKVHTLDLPNKEAVKLWMIENQLSRRSVTTFEKIRLALQFEPIYKDQARKQQGTRTDIGALSAQKFEPIDTIGKLAEIAGTGKRIVSMVKNILKIGDNDIIKKCSLGQLSIRNACLKSQDTQRRALRIKHAKQPCSYQNPIEGQFINQIICGDTLKTLKSIGKIMPRKVTCVICSPPYNTGADYGVGASDDNMPYAKYIDWLGKVILESSKLLRAGGRVIFNVSSHSLLKNYQNYDGDWITTIYPDLINKVRELDCGLKFYTEICWHKHNSGIKTVNGTYCSCQRPVIRRVHEYVIVWSYGQFDLPQEDGQMSDLTAEEFDEYTRSIWPLSSVTRLKTYHPNAFPDRLVTRLIKLFSYPGDTILDPFNGSGTTTAAAISLGRRYIGIDQNPNYCKFARKRTSQASKNR
jgi:site-specific DNA-methyltransferase (adenine-specific)